MKAIPEAGYQKEVFRTGMIAGNLTSLADRASSDFRRWNCKQSQPATPSTREPAHPKIPGQTSLFVKQQYRLCDFFILQLKFHQNQRNRIMLKGIFSYIWWTKSKREQILQKLWCADKRSLSPAFSDIHISHIMRTSMCSCHLWQELSYCLQ